MAKIASLLAVLVGVLPAAPAAAAAPSIVEFPIAGSVNPDQISPGLPTDPAPSVWVTDPYGGPAPPSAGLVYRVDVASGNVSGSFAPAEGATVPTFINRGPDGRMWTSDFNGTLMRAGSDGVFEKVGPDGYAHGGLSVGPDGNVWYVSETGGTNTGQVGFIDPSTQAVSDFDIPTAGSHPNEMTAGPPSDPNSMWFTEEFAAQIGRIDTTTHVVTEYGGLTAGSRPNGIVVGSDGGLWFAEYGAGKIGRIDPITHQVAEYGTPGELGGPDRMTVAPDGRIWFTLFDDSKIGSFIPGPNPTFDLIPTPTAGAAPSGITIGPDGRVWFAEYNNHAVARIDGSYETPTATTEAATAVTDHTATLNGKVSGGGAGVSYVFEWGTDTSYGHSVAATAAHAASAATTERLSAQLGGLSPDTTYHYRLVGRAFDGTVFPGPDESFTTSGCSTSAPYQCATYNLRVNGIEVTQGIQPDGDLQAYTGAPGTTRRLAYPTRDVTLVAGSKTIVRVWVEAVPVAAVCPFCGDSACVTDCAPACLSCSRDLTGRRSAPDTPPSRAVARQASGSLGSEPVACAVCGSGTNPVQGTVNSPEIHGALMRLYGYRKGKYVGAVDPSFQPDVVKRSPTDCACVTGAQRLDPAAAYEFTLPPAMASGDLDLKAVVYAPVGGNPSECATNACYANNALTLSGVPFTTVGQVVIAPLRVLVKGQTDSSLPAPGDVLSRALNLFPGGDCCFRVLPYAGTIDASAESQLTPSSPQCSAYSTPPVGTGTTNHFQDCRNDALFGRVGAVAGGFEAYYRYMLVMGINTQERGQGSIGSFITRPSASNGVSLVNTGRLISSVGHELGHNLGLNHAGTQCPNVQGTGEIPWPPDDKGYLQGIGLDRQLRLEGGPFEVIGRTYNDGYPLGLYEPSRWYDLMSYCAAAAPDATGPRLALDSWMSPVHWDALVGTLHAWGARSDYATLPNADRGTGSGFSAGGARAAGPGWLHVQAVASAARNTIVSIDPVPAMRPAPATSDYHAVVRDAAGSVLSETPMTVTEEHADPGPPQLALSADVPASGAHEVTISFRGTELAHRIRSPHPPTVRLAPLARHYAGRGSFTVHWLASSPDGLPLTISLAYSADGASWRTIFLGSGGSTAKVPLAYLSRSARGRLRITANDGFNATTAVSRPFRADGSGPQVTILEPRRAAAVRGRATVYLDGQATDDRGRLIPASRLSWYLGARLLGHGTPLGASNLPPGRGVLRLVAIDYAGRAASATAPIRVAGAHPVLTMLRLVGRLTSSSRSLTILIATFDPAIATVNGHLLAVGPKPRRLTLAVRANRRPVKLTLRLSGQGGSSSLSLIVRRSRTRR